MQFRHLATFAWISIVFFATAASAAVPERDIPGGHDSPLISRFPGSVMLGYHTVDFDQVTLPLGKYDDRADKFTKTQLVAGKVTEVAYAAPVGKSAFEVFQNYKAALAGAGATTRFECNGDQCGAMGAARAMAANDLVERLGKGADSGYFNSMLDTLWCANNSGLHLLTSRLTRAEGNIDVALMVCGKPGKPVGTLLRIVRERPMQTGEVTVNAKAMGDGLAQHGHIALYGIHFATDSAALAPDSNATLAQMVTLLKSKPDLKVYIVGHTDNTGTLQHNLALSQRRADTVVKALEAQGIAASRLSAKGLASYAPVASNDNEQGRAQNRRVELVEQ